METGFPVSLVSISMGGVSLELIHDRNWMPEGFVAEDFVPQKVQRLITWKCRRNSNGHKMYIRCNTFQ